MQVVGVTTQQEVYAVSKERKFRVNEILIIEDESLNYPRGEVVETLAYNRLIPMGMDKSLVDSQVISSLEQIGYDIGADEINLVHCKTSITRCVQRRCTKRSSKFKVQTA